MRRLSCVTQQIYGAAAPLLSPERVLARDLEPPRACEFLLRTASAMKATACLTSAPARCVTESGTAHPGSVSVQDMLPVTVCVVLVCSAARLVPVLALNTTNRFPHEYAAEMQAVMCSAAQQQAGNNKSEGTHT
jgi:hypothetical protein